MVMPAAYYNEFDPYAAEWLRNCIARGHIAPGDVDERSITEVHPDDLRGYRQCHFFAGIGGWSLAARLAGIPDDAELWTGSCPCQPFSLAGAGRGAADDRHLWPALFDLIRERRPAVVAGEQVAGGPGLAWWDAVHADLEDAGYAAAAANLCAAGAGGFHIRQRLYWVADAERRGAQPDGFDVGGPARGDEGPAREQRVRDDVGAGGAARRLAEAAGPGPQGGDEPGQRAGPQRPAAERGGAAHNPWADVQWIPCRDGVLRPTQPGLQPLAHGVPNRVGRLRAYGNAIVPQVAAAFLRAAIGGAA